MQKNVAGQKWIVFAFDRTSNAPKTGDAANITANLRIDGGAANAVDDINPAELEDGYYVFDISQAESNGDLLVIAPVSTTPDIQVIGVPGAVWTTPPGFNSSAAQTGDAFARLGAPAGASVSQDIAAVKGDTGGLRTDYTTARAGYLDNLSGGAVAQESTLTAMKGAGFDTAAHSLAAIRVRGDVAWITATGWSTAAQIADAVWDEALAGHLAAGSTGAALNAAGAAGDPWTTMLPGEYGAGTAGKIVGDALTGHAPQSGDSFSRIGTNGSGLTSVPWNAAWNASVQNDCAAALTAYDPPTSAEIISAFNEIKGATWSAVTDTLEAIRNRGDAAWTTADLSAVLASLSTITAYVDELETRLSFARAAQLDNIPLVKAVTDKLQFDASNFVKSVQQGAVDILQTAADKVWGSAARTLTGFGTLVSDIWTHATRKLTSAFTDEAAPRDMAATGVGGGEGSTIMVLPFSGSVQASYAKEGLTVEIIQGDTISLPYDLGKDLTGWNVLFAAKASLSAAGYAIAVKDITASLTDVLNGRGLIPLASAETGLTPGPYIAEIEIRKGGEAITAMRFILKVKRQVIS